VSLVLDGSVAVAWFFEDEQTDAVMSVLEAVFRAGAFVPSHWCLEVANALQAAKRRRRMDARLRDAALGDLASMNILLDGETDRQAWGSTLGLADRFGLTLYDAAYLELAERRTLPLATLDADLRAAGQRLGLALLGA
jgi:predicted nucleic acid-binding protein